MLIPLTKGYSAIIDAADWAIVEPFSWQAQVQKHTVYASTHPSGMGKIFMHRLIAGAPRGVDIDHVDHDGLNNRRLNLRAATRSQNMANGMPRGGTSRFKGVLWHKHARKWLASITFQGHNHYLGLFADENSAAEAYDVAARHFFGEFARVNFPT